MVSIYLDGASLSLIEKYDHLVSGYTSNPTLLRQANTKNYEQFARNAISLVKNKPISFEVLADDRETICKQAAIISTWGQNVFVKIPIVNSIGESNIALIRDISSWGIKVNVTAVMTLDQIRFIARTLSPQIPAIISIFAGRIADTGVDPCRLFYEAGRVKHHNTKILWASTREAYNIKQAEDCGSDIITCGPQIIDKMALFGKDLTEYSRETSEQFFNDGKEFSL